MADKVLVHTFLEGYIDPLLGYISFEKFDDPLLGLEALHSLGAFKGRAVGDPRRGLEATPDIEELGPFRISYDSSNPLLEAFERELPVRVDIRKKELDGGQLMTLLNFSPGSGEGRPSGFSRR